MTKLEVLTNRNYLSYSSMTSWLECGQQHELERVLGALNRAWWFIGGNAVHKATEMLDKARSCPLSWHGTRRGVKPPTTSAKTSRLSVPEVAGPTNGPTRKTGMVEHHGPLFTHRGPWMADKRASMVSGGPHRW